MQCCADWREPRQSHRNAGGPADNVKFVKKEKLEKLTSEHQHILLYPVVAIQRRTAVAVVATTSI